MSSRRSNADRSASTRRALISAARDQFVTLGYARTTIAGVVAASGCTTGALYHHWSGKDALLGSVIESIHSELGRAIARRTRPGTPPRTRLTLAGVEFLRLCTHVQTARLLLVDGPAGLGYERWREIDDGWWLTPTMLLLQECTGSTVPRSDLRHTALCILGSLTYLGREVAHDPDRNFASACRAYTGLVTAVLGPDPPCTP